MKKKLLRLLYYHFVIYLPSTYKHVGGDNIENQTVIM